MRNDSKTHIFVIDDDECIRKAACTILQSADYDCTCFPDGESCLEQLKPRKCDLLITDVKMPGMSGVQLLARAAEMRPDIVRMLITGWVNEIPPERLEEVGICALVTKPWDDAKLKATLRAVMGAAQGSRSPGGGSDTPDRPSDYSLRR